MTPRLRRGIQLCSDVSAVNEASDCLGGHEVLIAGYDDGITIADPDRRGKSNHGAFIIRNSWGPYAGDHGDYYMSYDFFKVLAMDASALLSSQYTELF